MAHMSCWVVVAAVLAASLVWAAENELTDQERADGWKLLFDGKTLDGWATTGKKEGWEAEEGALACMLKGGGYCRTIEQFDDFVLSVDFKVSPKCNSGVFFRWSDLKDPVHTGIEMQVLDSFGKEKPTKHDCGAIYDILAPTKNMAKPAGEWQTAVITCKDNLITIALNGEQICEMDLNQWAEAGKNPDGSKNKFKYAYKDLPRKGHIGFQDHGHRVWYRNIKLKPLKP